MISASCIIIRFTKKNMAQKATFTRASTEVKYPLVGSLEEIKQNYLPTKLDIIKNFLYIREFSGFPNRDLVKNVSTALATSVQELWTKASLPCISHRSIVRRIETLYKSYLNLMKTYSREKETQSKYFIENSIQFQQQSSTLFDISLCTCKDYNTCNCIPTNKVPVDERQFLYDQRTEQKMFISSIDKNKYLQNQKKEMRERKYDNFRLKHSSSLEIPSTSKTLVSRNQPLDQVESKPPARSTSGQMRQTLSNVAMACDRYGLSNAAGSAIVSATLQDIGIIKETDMSMVVDKNKIKRERQRLRKSLFANRSTHIQCLYYDGRKDQTKVLKKVGSTYHPGTEVHEHIVLVEEPNSVYIGHVSPKSGTAAEISSAIIEYLNLFEIQTEDLCIVGCDSTNVNTGRRNGINHLMELYLNRPLNWFVCILHTNELLLRHIFQSIDGKTSGPTSFSGVIGSKLKTCENLPRSNFERIRITTNFPQINCINDLSTDQKLLYYYCQLVSEGKSSKENLLDCKIGPLNHARWLTLAIRILRLYVSTARPTSQLKDVAEFVVLVYAPIWFQIKAMPSCVNGPKHFFKMIQLTRYLKYSYKDVIDKVLKRNAYFGHSENLLLAMISDEREYVRELAIRKIILFSDNKTQEIREFKVPELILDATDYFSMIDWTKSDRFPPPLLRDVSIQDLKKCVDLKSLPNLSFLNFPCHNQGVERCVKLVTESANLVVGHNNRDGFIRARMKSRELMPTFSTKKDYKLMEI